MMYFVLIVFALVLLAIISSNRHSARNPSSTEAPPWLARLPLLPLVILALVGFVLSIIVHGLSIFGVLMPGGNIVFVLHIGIFVIWFPAVMLSQGQNRKSALDKTPLWMKRALLILGAYALLNFAYFLVVAPKKGSPEANQHTAPPKVLRGFSGHWMLFYGAGFSMLWCEWKERREAMNRRCPNGHTVP